MYYCTGDGVSRGAMIIVCSCPLCGGKYTPLCLSGWKVNYPGRSPVAVVELLLFFCDRDAEAEYLCVKSLTKQV